MLDNMLDRVEQAKVHYQTFDQETATQWKQQIASTRAKFSHRHVRLNNKLQVTMQIINRSIMLERSEEHTSELQSLMRISYDVFFLKNIKVRISIERHAKR